MKRLISIVSVAVVAAAFAVTPAFADPDFGPGSSSKGPQDPGAQCHPPGQTLPSPECK